MVHPLYPNVWGPHYWFFLHTIALCYPHRPNDNTKKKYYDFIHNLPLFLPVSTDFSALLDKYPVTPYLDSRDSLIRWMHFIHNKINTKLEKPTLSLHEFYRDYYEAYKSKDIKNKEWYNVVRKLIYIFLLGSIVFLSVWLYNVSL